MAAGTADEIPPTTSPRLGSLEADVVGGQEYSAPQVDLAAAIPAPPVSRSSTGLRTLPSGSLDVFIHRLAPDAISATSIDACTTRSEKAETYRAADRPVIVIATCASCRLRLWTGAKTLGTHGLRLGLAGWMSQPTTPAMIHSLLVLQDSFVRSRKVERNTALTRGQVRPAPLT